MHPGMLKGELAQLRFSLFKAHQDIGDYDEAFSHLSEGNSLRSSEIGYTLQNDQARTTDIRAELVDLISRAAQEQPIVIDKMPVNFRWVGILCSIFPEAKFVYTNRSAINVCWSLYKVCFTSAGNGFCYDQVHVAVYQKKSRILMAHWKTLFPDRIYTLDFEDLTTNQEIEAKKLVAFCELGWSDRCLDLASRDRAIFTASQHQARRPIYPTKEPDWLKYAAHLAPMKQALGLH